MRRGQRGPCGSHGSSLDPPGPGGRGEGRARGRLVV